MKQVSSSSIKSFLFNLAMSSKKAELNRCEVVIFLYRKIPKIGPGTFLRVLFLEGLRFGGAYLRRENCVSEPIGLAI